MRTSMFLLCKDPACTARTYHNKQMLVQGSCWWARQVAQWVARLCNVPTLLLTEMWLLMMLLCHQTPLTRLTRTQCFGWPETDAVTLPAGGTVSVASESGRFCRLELGRVRRHDPDLPVLLPTAREVAGAMAYLHSQGLIHGDLSGEAAEDCDSRDYAPLTGAWSGDIMLANSVYVPL